MPYIEVPCPRCGGSGKIICDWCKGQGGWSETSGGETTYKKCPYCESGRKKCDGGCGGWGKVKVWRD